MEKPRICLRPQRSLTHPPISAPPMPAPSRTERDAPDSHKLAPSSVKKVGRNAVREAIINARTKTMPDRGIMTGAMRFKAACQVSALYADMTRLATLLIRNKSISEATTPAGIR